MTDIQSLTETEASSHVPTSSVCRALPDHSAGSTECAERHPSIYQQDGGPGQDFGFTEIVYLP